MERNVLKPVWIFFLSLLTGRLFDFHVLDMIELGIEKYISLSDIKVIIVCTKFYH